MLLQNLIRNEFALISQLPAQVRLLSLSCPHLLDQRWRSARGLQQNPNSDGVLLQKPDYSFLDGRPTPYGSRQMKRILKHREIAEKIVTLSKEIDFAVERHQNNIEAEKMRRQNVISNKLKPKGDLLLKKT